MRIDNQKANEVITRAKRGDVGQEFYDLVSGVESYSFTNLKRQGVVVGKFLRELGPQQYLVSKEDLVSEFWTGVATHISKAKLWGELVTVQTADGPVERPTLNNPLHYLRMHGYHAARNYINTQYRRNLVLSCSACGHTSSARPSRICPKCEGNMTSDDICVSDDEIEFQKDDTAFCIVGRVEHLASERAVRRLVHDFSEVALTRERRVRDERGEWEYHDDGTHATTILNLLLTGYDERTGMRFNLEEASNYCAEIGQLLGVNKTFIAMKMKRLRYALADYLQNQALLWDDDDAERIYDRIPDKFRDKSLRKPRPTKKRARSRAARPSFLQDASVCNTISD